jgi:hypothetical protein
MERLVQNLGHRSRSLDPGLERRVDAPLDRGEVERRQIRVQALVGEVSLHRTPPEERNSS